MLRLPHGDAVLRTATAIVPAVRLVFRRGDTELAVERVVSARFTVDARRDQRWDGHAVINTDLLPLSPHDLFTPFGTTVETHLGVVLSDGTVSTVPFGQYVVTGSDLTLGAAERSVTLRMSDLSEFVAQYRFEAPLTVPPETDVADVVATVIASRVGSPPVLDPTGFVIGRRRTFGLDTGTDPWRELVDVVAGFGMRLYYSRTGDLVLDAPGALADPVAMVGPLQVSSRFDRRPPNVVVARGEPTDGAVPVQATAWDADPSSPTWAGDAPGDSPYGRVTEFFSSPLLTTLGEAERAALARLADSAGAGAGWRVSRPFDPTWDPDDVIGLSVPTNNARTDFLSLVLQVDAVTVNAGADTVLETRALVDPATFRVDRDVIGPDSPSDSPPDSPPDSPGEVWAVDVFDEPGEWEWDWDAAGQPATVEVLVVAGGGGGGARQATGTNLIGGGGGGAGGVIYDAAVAVSGNVAVVVGAGGIGAVGATPAPGTNGDDSQFGALVAVGGGRGGWAPGDNPGGAGGSGGGGRGNTGSGGAGTVGQGNDGGNGSAGQAQNRQGGGGGAGAAGQNGVNNGGGDGGVGLEFPQFAAFGDSGWFAGGGGGGGYTSGFGQGGKGGGGDGNVSSGTGVAGQPNTGGGGGGGGGDTGGGGSVGGAGGSGIVLVRYLAAP